MLTFTLYWVFMELDAALLFATLALAATYPLGSLLHSPGECLATFGALPVYCLLLPLYLIVLPLRAYANTHDVSWGSRGLGTTCP